jgi:hypothetical protein
MYLYPIIIILMLLLLIGLIAYEIFNPSCNQIIVSISKDKLPRFFQKKKRKYDNSQSINKKDQSNKS